MTALKNLTEQALIALIREGEEHAIAEFLNRYKGRFYTAAYLLVKDRDLAEDIFQDACVKIIQSIRAGRYQDDGKFLPWAMRITRNLCYDHLRAAKRAPRVTLPDGQDIFALLDMGEHNAEDRIMSRQSGDRVRQMLDHIPHEQREVIVLRMYGNLSFKEIAELTDVGINTALGRMRYGLINLRKLMQEKRLAL